MFALLSILGFARAIGLTIKLVRHWESDSLVSCVDVEAVSAEEAYQGHPKVPRQRDGQAARRRHGAEDGCAGDQAFLKELETGPAADHHQVIREGEASLEERQPTSLSMALCLP